MSVIGRLAAEIHVFIFLLTETHCVWPVMNHWFRAQAQTVTESSMCHISITNGPMALIFYSLLVLMSASRLWNMDFKLALVLEISVDMPNIHRLPLLLQTVVENRIFKFWSIFCTLSELISASKSRIAFGPFLQTSSMCILIGKNTRSSRALPKKKIKNFIKNFATSFQNPLLTSMEREIFEL